MISSHLPLRTNVSLVLLTSISILKTAVSLAEMKLSTLELVTFMKGYFTLSLALTI